ncbi:hypothetical protein MLD38_007714 [Melastoma candidum]|uniref:Uncharacterized protein n=1 Tax=Melastoma candidum TaxID=119954 RepID=A0ACB9RRP3_9MYRT|nr:hypothetical protein MLD38_007714 [Melastoma candidum]
MPRSIPQPPPPPPTHLRKNRKKPSLPRQDLSALRRDDDDDEDADDLEFPYLPPQRPPNPGAIQLHGNSSLYKQRSWSPDTFREEAWLRRKGNCRNRRSKSVTDEDVDELKACIELGFGFDSPEAAEGRLSDTLPALGFYYAVTKQYHNSVSKLARSPSAGSTDCDAPSSPVDSPSTLFGPSDSPQVMKTRLRQWAQVVACSVRQSPCS